jgi:hypothetical protein
MAISECRGERKEKRGYRKKESNGTVSQQNCTEEK